MIGANTAEHDFSNDVGRKTTDDFAGEEVNSLSTSSTVGGIIDPNTGSLWIGKFDIWTDGSLAMSTLI